MIKNGKVSMVPGNGDIIFFAITKITIEKLLNKSVS